MTYREWVIANWQRSAAHKRHVEAVNRCQGDLDKLNAQIALAERGEIPTDHVWFKDESASFLGNLMTARAVFRGISAKDLQQERWMREALEAEAKRKEHIAHFLRIYRDSLDFDGKPEKSWFSRPYYEAELREAQNALSNCNPAPVYDWTVEEFEDDDWYDKSQRVLSDMLIVLGGDTSFGFDEALANVMTELTDHRFGFMFITRMSHRYYATCTVTNRYVPKAKMKCHGDNLWEAVLRALLNYIDTNWETLLTAVEKYDNAED